ncbi:Ankyrin repeat domain-containing protein 42, partial [Pichia californica]
NENESEIENHNQKHDQNQQLNCSNFSNSSNEIIKKETKQFIADKLPSNLTRDANGYPILSREFVVRRISEGETGRLKEELKCEACGKGYKHITSLAKHLWEHTAEWQTTKKLLISKHQQAQLLEAASILCSIGENPLSTQQPSNNPSIPIEIPEIKVDSENINGNYVHNNQNNNKLYQINNHIIPIARRKSKSETTKAGKFGGKRRSKSFVLSSSPAPSQLFMTNNNGNNTNEGSIINISNNNSNGAITQNNNNNNNNNQHVLASTDQNISELESSNNRGSMRYAGSSTGVLSSVRRDSESAYPPIDLRRSSMHMSPSISISASRRGSLLGSLIKEEKEHDNDAENSLVIYDSEDEY